MVRNRLTKSRGGGGGGLSLVTLRHAIVPLGRGHALFGDIVIRQGIWPVIMATAAHVRAILDGDCVSFSIDDGRGSEAMKAWGWWLQVAG